MFYIRYRRTKFQTQQNPSRKIKVFLFKALINILKVLVNTKNREGMLSHSHLIFLLNFTFYLFSFVESLGLNGSVDAMENKLRLENQSLKRLNNSLEKVSKFKKENSHSKYYYYYYLETT
jgi:hypothetical protein